jgi:hypothetical protein
MTINALLLSLPFALGIGVAAAQTSSWPIVDGRQRQPTQQQIDRRESIDARQPGRDVQSDIDSLYDEIMRASAPTGASSSSMELEAGEAR